MKLMRFSSWIVMAIMMSNCLLIPTAMALPQPARTVDSSAQLKPVSINKANLEELQMVRGIGPALAERILNWRQTNGGFKSLDELKEVRGIGDAKFEKIKDQITL